MPLQIIDLPEDAASRYERFRANHRATYSAQHALPENWDDFLNAINLAAAHLSSKRNYELHIAFKDNCLAFKLCLEDQSKKADHCFEFSTHYDHIPYATNGNVVVSPALQGHGLGTEMFLFKIWLEHHLGYSHTSINMTDEGIAAWTGLGAIMSDLDWCHYYQPAIVRFLHEHSQDIPRRTCALLEDISQIDDSRCAFLVKSIRDPICIGAKQYTIGNYLLSHPAIDNIFMDMDDEEGSPFSEQTIRGHFVSDAPGDDSDVSGPNCSAILFHAAEMENRRNFSQGMPYEESSNLLYRIASVLLSSASSFDFYCEQIAGYEVNSMPAWHI
ncbi:hypothetical protein GC177_03210 [bacterium]|nr:hypothetical protein [bacterium]